MTERNDLKRTAMKKPAKIKRDPLVRPEWYRGKFARAFGARYALRFHMALILTVAAGGGFLATWGFHRLHMENVAIRYPLAVLLSYAVFFVAVKIWLRCVSCAPAPAKGGDSLYDPSIYAPDVPYVGPGMPAGTGSGACSIPDAPGASLFQGGGSGGGGADRVFDGPADAGLHAAVPDDCGTGAGEAVGDVLSGAADAADGEGGLAVIVCVGVLALAAAAVFGVGIYLLYAAPTILSEAAFNVVLAGSLVRSGKRISCDDWMGSVFKATRLPFALTLLLALAAGGLIHSLLPGVTTVSELFRLFLVSR